MCIRFSVMPCNICEKCSSKRANSPARRAIRQVGISPPSSAALNFLHHNSFGGLHARENIFDESVRYCAKDTVAYLFPEVARVHRARV